MTDLSPPAGDPSAVAFMLFLVLALICSGGAFAVYRLFVKRFAYSGWLALPMAVTWGITVFWAGNLSAVAGAFEYIDSEQMFYTVWGFGLAYLSYFYNGYKSHTGHAVGPTDLLMVALSMPIFGFVSTGLWLLVTRKKLDVQRESRHSISLSLRLFHFIRLFMVVIAVWVFF